MKTPGRLPRVCVDISPLFEDHWTGIPVFTRRLVQSLMTHDGIEVDFSFQMTKVPNGAVLAAIRAGMGTSLRGDFERKAGEAYPLIDPNAHCLFPSVKECFGISMHEASTVHDVSTLVMPECHQKENVNFHMRDLAKQLATDEVVFCVSEATRQALILAFPSAAPKTRILPQYVDWPSEFEGVERNLPPPVVGRYAVVIGTVEPRKNLELLIRSLKEPLIRDSDLRFVIIGKQGWKVEEIMASLSPVERTRLIFLGYISEFMKYRLLRHAEFLVYPSLYEGFGIPALEAMSLGKPVLAARTSSFPELIADAGIYFDPLSISEFSEAFAEISDTRNLADLAPRALERSGQYDAEGMARPVVQWATQAQR